MEVVLKTCEAGMRARLTTERPTPDQALAVLVAAPADVLFRRGHQSAR
jgi:hypothetical protein